MSFGAEAELRGFFKKLKFWGHPSRDPGIGRGSGKMQSARGEHADGMAAVCGRVEVIQGWLGGVSREGGQRFGSQGGQKMSTAKTQ